MCLCLILFRSSSKAKGHKRKLKDQLSMPGCRAVERGGQGGKLPLAPRQRRGPAIPQNEFLSPLGMKAEVDNSNVNFSQLCDDVSSTIEQLFSHCHCAAHALCLLYSEEMNDPCDFVQFSYYGVILLSVISYHFSCLLYGCV